MTKALLALLAIATISSTFAADAEPKKETTPAAEEAAPAATEQK